ncbi:discoidin domain-containing protein [Luteimicrobium subarcticum]|uniref:Glucosylceramidase n=1 Tax=Luteimicrobium subarcticum TaxID=620910 RepID=A0A2M8W751_9MICO|nr:glycoside hydrolase family 30 beta sandwich domain-containing protein [Luteimicrobium subarcticum]PJI86766.1 glucosylceramidase [Luteimicrobium subarcticum]
MTSPTTPSPAPRSHRPRHARRALAAGTAIATAITLAAVAAPTATAHDGGGTAAGQARVWLTTVDGSQRLTEQAPLPFTSTATDATTITVEPTQTYQTMDGFGGALTDSSAAVLYRLSPTARDAAMRSLFSPTDGIGVSFLRQPIGSSDFTAASAHYTYDDVPAGQTDFSLRHFSVAHDEAQILPLLRRAKKLNPSVTIVATPWSPPAWMKTGGSLVGGRLVDDPRYYDAYARYLVKYVQAYAAAGVPIDYLTVQNEPQNRTPSGYPGTDMGVAQEAKVVEALGPLLKKASPRTKILGYDHNWSTHPNDVASAPADEAGDDDYPYDLLDSPAGKWLAGTAYHCYYGDPSAQSALHDAHPDKGIWFTECSGSHGASDTYPQYFKDTLKWHARTITLGTTRNWAKSVLDWNLVLDDQNGPYLGGCDTCTGFLDVTADGTVQRNAEYYTIGHLSKFVKPGAVRIGSTSFGTTGWNGQVMDVAFRNPDGSTVVVAHNENDDPRTVAIAVGSQHVEYTLPGGSLATFTWPGSVTASAFAGLSGLVPVSLAHATATASSAAGDAGLAIDADGSTRWSSGAAQAPGQYVQVDLGKATVFRRVAVDAGGNLGDYARGWTVSTSLDGTHWRDAASGVGTGQLTNVDLRLTLARYVRVTQTASSGSWWSVADVRLYR